MELKLRLTHSRMPSFLCFNRTFMELKSRINTKKSHPVRSFNRTFMELKYAWEMGERAGRAVLIVPLWNWNYFSRPRAKIEENVLIVPLWNWNRAYALPLAEATAVLIVPLWNWNTVAIFVLLHNCSFNRTFMELKSRYKQWLRSLHPF